VKNYNKIARQAGMTLIELTVVLLVLIGLAGLMIPYVGSFVSKTHDSTGSQNVARVNEAIVRYQTTAGVYPRNMDSLINVTGNPYTALMNASLVTANTLTAGVAADDIEISSLRASGITSVMNMLDAPVNATFGAANAQIPVSAVAAATTTLGLVSDTTTKMGMDTSDAVAQTSTQEHLQTAFGRKFDTTCYNYYVFGVGSDATMIGKTMTDAPVHFSGNQESMGPTDKYNRFIAVFQVDKSNDIAVASNGVDTTKKCSTITEPAKLVGTGMAMMGPHLWGLNHSLEHAYENTKTELSGS